MTMIRIFTAAAFAGIFLGMTSCTPKGQADGGTQDTVASNHPTKEQHPKTAETVSLDDSWETLGNNEMVMYCLPYPKADFKEDFDNSPGKGAHLLVANDKSGSILFVGGPAEMGLDEFFETVVSDVEMISGNAPIKKQKHTNGFEVIWDEKGKRHALRKWVRESEGETVTADFTYDPIHADRYEKWFKVVSGHSSNCE